MRTIIIAAVVYVVMRVIDIKIFPIDEAIKKVLAKSQSPAGSTVVTDDHGQPVTGDFLKVVDNGNGTSTIYYMNGQKLTVINGTKK